MEVNPSNFFSHLIFHPTDAKTEKDQKITLAASIALGIFTLGLIHLVCAIAQYIVKPMLASEGKNPEISSIAKERLPGEKKELGNPPPPTTPIQAQSIQDPQTPLDKRVIGNISIEIYQGDLLQQPVDAIVNPANTTLNGGGGVDGLIGKAAGRSIYEECQEQLKLKNLSRCQVGDATITGSGKLNERGITHVIHAVGPRNTTPNRDELLKNAYYNSLLRAHETGLKSIAFPAISIGIFGFPPGRAAEIAYQAISEFCEKYPETTLTQIRLVFWKGDQDVQSLERMRQLFEKEANS